MNINTSRLNRTVPGRGARFLNGGPAVERVGEMRVPKRVRTDRFVNPCVGFPEIRSFEDGKGPYPRPMKTSRFSEAKIISVLERNERGEKVPDPAEKSASATRRVGQRRPLQLEGQIRRPLRQRPQTLEGPGGRECAAEEDVCRPLACPRCAEGCCRKKALSPGEKRRLVTHMNQEHRVSIRQGCRAVGLARSTYW